MDIFLSVIHSKQFIGYTIALISATIYVFKLPKRKKSQRTLILLVAVGLTLAGLPIIK